LVEKATRLADVRDKSGWFSKCHYDAETGFRIEEFHNPLKKIYKEYTNAVRMEVQMMEQLLGTKIARTEVSIGKGRKRVVYEIATLGIRQEGLKTPNAPARNDNEGDQGSLF
jgi:predicted ArsR family transcriptional regulator